MSAWFPTVHCSRVPGPVAVGVLAPAVHQAHAPGARVFVPRGPGELAPPVILTVHPLAPVHSPVTEI